MDVEDTEVYEEEEPPKTSTPYDDLWSLDERNKLKTPPRKKTAQVSAATGKRCAIVH
ncbi:Stage V sporulation protein R [Geobacillus sp. WSUCF1]|nr:Stage V sporulation protein R [Geobacillus sp. WSUCF1]